MHVDIISLLILKINKDQFHLAMLARYLSIFMIQYAKLTLYMLKKAFILPISILLVITGIWLIIHFYAPLALAYLQNNPPTSPPDQSNSTYTINEVSKHNTATDCWTIIENNVYNVTSFIDQHPGGDRITQACGIDATQLFKIDFPHNAEGEAVLKDYFIGELKK
jgi:hypothetical protein